MKAANENYLDKAYLRKFDQHEMIDLAAEDYKKIAGNEDTVIDFQFHQMLKWGYIFIQLLALRRVKVAKCHLPSMAVVELP